MGGGGGGGGVWNMSRRLGPSGGGGAVWSRREARPIGIPVGEARSYITQRRLQ